MEERVMIMKTIVLMSILAALWAGSVAQAQPIQAVTESSAYAGVHDGKVVGSATKVVEAVLQDAGLTDYRINLYPWARSYEMALHDPNVLIYVIARTLAREKMFKWTGEFLRMEYHLYRLKDRKDIVVGSLDDARNYTIGATRNDFRHQYLQAKGFTKVVVSAENIDNFKKLISRQIQLIPLPENDAARLCEEAHFDCSQLEKVYTLDEVATGLYMAFSNATPDAVVDRVKASFQKLKLDGTVAKLMSSKP